MTPEESKALIEQIKQMDLAVHFLRIGLPEQSWRAMNDIWKTTKLMVFKHLPDPNTQTPKQ